MKIPVSLVCASFSRRSVWCAAFVAVQALIGYPSQCHGAPLDPPELVQDSVWYDAESGSILPVVVEPTVEDSIHRESRWLPKAKKVAKPKTANSSNGTIGGAGTGAFGSGLSLGNVMAWGVLAMILCIVIAGLIYGLNRVEVELAGGNRKKASALHDDDDQQTIERIKHLPAELRVTGINLRSEAERLLGEGNYDQAIILLFGHQLLLLDRSGHLRLNRGKTNRRYLRECKASAPMAEQVLRGTINAFERSYFGRHPLDRDEANQLWQNNIELEQLIDQANEAAA